MWRWSTFPKTIIDDDLVVCCVCWWPSYGCAVRVDTLFSKAAQPSLDTMYQTVKKHCRVNQYIISINTWKQYIVRVRTPPSNTLYQIQHRSISAQAQAGWSPCVRWLWWWTINSSPLAPYSPTLWHYYTKLLWWIRALSTCVRLPILT